MKTTSVQGFIVLFAFISMGTALPAYADISLDKVIIEFNPAERPIHNINVTNQSDKATKVSVEMIEVTNAGQAGETEKQTDKLVVAPKAFELQGGETKAVRLVLRQYPDDLEEIYRVRFKPSEVSFVKKETSGATTVNVGIIMAMGALIMVPPKNPKPDLQPVRDGKIVHFFNKGNVTAQLQREDFCTDDKKTCVVLPTKRIYPNMVWDMPVPDALVNLDFSQTVLMNGQYSKIVYSLKK
jgi:hypothetical protein